MPCFSSRPSPRQLVRARRDIIACERCPRLRDYCRQIARDKRAQYRDEQYWGKPVPGFGDPAARVLIVGLAPAAHGANRTGRFFTGDGRGGSGDFLMAALHRAGFANHPVSTRADDGLVLRQVFIAAAVRCAPPQNKPLPSEIAACAVHLDAEIAALERLHIVLTLGKIAWDAWFAHLARMGHNVRPRPLFGHGMVWEMASSPSGSSITRLPPIVIGCYHPSRQNTQTGKVTPEMYDEVLQQVRGCLRQ